MNKKMNLGNILKKTAIAGTLAATIAGCTTNGPYSVNRATTNADLAHMYTTQLGSQVKNLRQGCFDDEDNGKVFTTLAGVNQNLEKIQTKLITCGYEQRQSDKNLVWWNTAADIAKWYVYISAATKNNNSNSGTTTDVCNGGTSGSGQGGSDLSGDSGTTSGVIYILNICKP